VDSTPSLDDLVSRWRQHQLKGESVSMEELCGQCPEKAAELKERLEAVASMMSFLGLEAGGKERANGCYDTTTTSAFGRGPADKTAAPAVQGEIPGYEILAELGRGGMGVVYKARQKGLNRIVALKMILAGRHAGPAQLGRFKAEAEAVARLQHSNIVQIYDIGEHEELPYFSLEYVEGGSLDRQLDGTPQPPVQAARLLETLAQAVEVAHQNGVIHRDLKPGNILLQLIDSAVQRDSSSSASGLAMAVPKITDFGLAKLEGEAGKTQSGAVLGTPSYMAPEQADGKTGEAGPLADVYGLGAILYVLLTGRPPFKGATVLDTLEQVRFQEPVAPSRLQPKVPRDLETVCLKCLHKDPARRYASAGALAEDLRRFLENRPILARPVGRAERLWRWCRRNPVVAGLSAALVVVLLGSLAGLTLLWLRAEAEADAAVTERQRAEDNAAKALKQQGLAEEQSRIARAEADKAGKIAQFLSGLFEANDPLGLSSAPLLTFRTGEIQTAREILDRGAERVAKDLKAEPEVRAKLLDTLGGVYCTLGLTEKARPLLEEGLRLCRQVLPPDHPELANNLHNLGWLHHQRGDWPLAEQYYQEALAIRRRHETRDPLAVSTTLFTLAWLRTDQEEFPEAERLFREALAMRQKHLGPEHRDVAVALGGLASVYLTEGRFKDALNPSLKALAVLKKVGENRGLAESILLFQKGILARELPVIGGALLGLGGPADAPRHFRQCLELTQKILGDRHPYTALVQHELALALVRVGKDYEAEQCFRECLTTARPYGLDHPKVQIAVINFTELLRRRGKRAEAEALVRETLEACRQRYGADHPLVANVLLAQANLLDRPKDRERREQVLREAAAMYRKAPGPPRRNLTNCLNRLSVCINPKRPAEAEELVADAIRLARAQKGDSQSLLALMLCNLAWSRMDQGKVKDVEEPLREALGIASKAVGDQASTVRYAWQALGRYYRATKQPAQAADAAVQRRKLAGQNPAELFEAARDLALCAALENTEARKKYEDLAMATLRQARKCGFADLARLRTDPAFAPLRTRPDFQELVQVEKK
jgi:serine/threonine protein kinase